MSALIHSTRRAVPHRRCALTEGHFPEHRDSVSPRPRRTVDLGALADFDQARLRALLFRSREHTKHDWLEAHGAAAEVRIVDSSDVDTAQTHTGRDAQLTIQISDARDPMHMAYAPHLLVRPLLLGGLVEVLLRLEAHFTNLERSSTFGESATSHAPRVKGPVDYTACPAYRLRKWPPEKLLQRKASHDQIAKAFFEHPLTIAQASRMSRTRYAQCWAFIRECMAAGIVEVLQPVCAQSLPAPNSRRIEQEIAPTVRSTSSSRLFARLVAYFG